jgi:hypothetical protein
MAELSTGILVAGGGVGGCAAALAAVRRGCRIILTEETDWVGGQLTAQAVPPDEHGWIERFGCTASYREFRNRVRDYYRRNYPLATAARSDVFLNPGNGWVSPLCHEPRVAVAVLEEMLAPFRSSGALTVLLEHRAFAVELSASNRIGAVTLQCSRTGERTTIAADWILDATELGDLLPLCGAEFVTGAEPQSRTGEPSAPSEAQPANVQAFSVCFALSHHHGENHTIGKPEMYERWRSFVPALDPPWPGPLLSWTTLNPRTMEPLHYRFDPHREPRKAFSGLWTYRRILDRGNFAAGAMPSDITIVNWPMIDYLDGDLCTSSETERMTHIEKARELSRSVVYWLQTDAPRADGGTGWPGLRLRGDITGSIDGLAKSPYIRESRRIEAVHTIVEHDVSAAARPGHQTGGQYRDSVGIGYYRIDLHPSSGGNNYIDVAALPFEIPLGAFIPVRMLNLLPACKNIGTTHITNGCYRLHPVEWNIGEAAGALAAFCAEKRASARSVLEQEHLLEEYRRDLSNSGVELSWPAGLDLEQGDPHIHAL